MGSIEHRKVTSVLSELLKSEISTATLRGRGASRVLDEPYTQAAVTRIDKEYYVKYKTL